LIIEKDDINTRITNQATINDLDTISGVTFTSKGIKESIGNIISDYQNGVVNE